METDQRIPSGSTEPNEPQLETDRLWNEKEAARFLGLSHQFLRNDRMARVRVPFIKIGSAIRYEPADVIAFKNSCRVIEAVPRTRRKDDQVDLDCFIQPKPGRSIPASPGVYALLVGDKLLYIGMASNIARRVTQHWFTWEECWWFLCNETRARAIEANLIGKHQPKYNEAHK